MSPGSRPKGRPSMIRSPSAAMPRPIKTSALPMTAPSDELHAREEVADLVGGGLRAVRAVRRVALDRLGELTPERARLGLRRVGRAHERPPFPDRVGRLE